jgi:hypothetical protein
MLALTFAGGEERRAETARLNRRYAAHPLMLVLTFAGGEKRRADTARLNRRYAAHPLMLALTCAGGEDRRAETAPGPPLRRAPLNAGVDVPRRREAARGDRARTAATPRTPQCWR